MITTCKTIEEFNKIADSISPSMGNSIGRGFYLSELKRAKKLNLFDKLRTAIKELSDDGVGVYYICTDEKDLESDGEDTKWLMFSFTGAKEGTGNKVLSILRDICNGEQPRFDSVYDMYTYMSFGSGWDGATGEASTCPLFK